MFNPLKKSTKYAVCFAIAAFYDLANISFHAGSSELLCTHRTRAGHNLGVVFLNGFQKWLVHPKVNMCRCMYVCVNGDNAKGWLASISA